MRSKKTKIRTCAYARVSTAHAEQENSLQNQIETYTRLIKENPAYEFAGVYADRGVSGRSDKRPAFRRMIQDARDGKIDLIITKSISRFSRNTVTLLEYVRELKDLGVEVIFEENNQSTATSEGEMMLSILASFAQEESRSISENTKWAARKKFERGEGYINTKRFLGYDKDKGGNLVINEEEAKIVRRIFDMYLSGMGSFRIKNKLNKEGVPTVTGAKWECGTILTILKNEKYKGDSLLQKTYRPEYGGGSKQNNGAITQYYVKEDHEPIVSKEDWEAAQELMAYNCKKQGNERGSKKCQKRYPNSGMLKCPYCGASLIRRKAFCGEIEWLCATYINQGKGVCKGIRIRDSMLQGQVFTEPTVAWEVTKNGEKYYRYTGKAEYDFGIREDDFAKEESVRILPRVNRTRRTVIKL